jgi:hypothetical protein
VLKIVASVLCKFIIRAAYLIKQVCNPEVNIILNDDEYNFESIKMLLRAIDRDPVINKKVTRLLKMDSYPRHIVLSSWLEQLRLNNAPNTLTQTLSYLFDDVVAEKVLSLINNHMTLNN